jgi:small subunit ribosomal protein S6
MYEAVYIFDSTLEDPAIADRLTKYHDLLGNPGDLTTDHWGRRTLAYPINRRETGYYVVERFSVEPALLPEYERALKLDEGLLRHLLTLSEHELGAPADVVSDTDSDDDDEEE